MNSTVDSSQSQVRDFLHKISAGKLKWLQLRDAEWLCFALLSSLPEGISDIRNPDPFRSDPHTRLTISTVTAREPLDRNVGTQLTRPDYRTG